MPISESGITREIWERLLPLYSVSSTTAPHSLPITSERLNFTTLPVWPMPSATTVSATFHIAAGVIAVNTLRIRPS